MIRRIAAVLLPLLMTALLLTACSSPQAAEHVKAFQSKAALLKAQVVTEEIAWELGDTPAGAAGNVVFLSVSDGQTRASVYTGSGETLEEAWDTAAGRAEKGLKKGGPAPLWVKADVVYLAQKISMGDLQHLVETEQPGFFRYGAALDEEFSTALLEAELNGAQIYAYETGGLDLEALNRYLKDAGRKTVKTLPEQVTAFRCFGWLCDEEDQVLNLASGSLDYGRRRVETVDAAYADQIIATGADHLVRQLREDGSFVYGYYPQWDQQAADYNILRHAGTLWSLVCRYRMTQDQTLLQQIETGIDYLLSQVVFHGADTAYVYEESSDEIKLGGCGLSVIALTEYMDATGTDHYAQICRQLGNGILSLLDLETGEYYHVLNPDFSPKEAVRTVYYDGEATFALCRLYSLTGEQQWLDAAQAAVDHFLEADYVQYRDQWVAYSMNEITKHITDRPDYYAFALENVQENLEKIDLDTTTPVCFELLMTTFELYDRLVQRGATTDGFDGAQFLQTIANRAQRGLDGYIYPEIAMYFADPQSVLGAFMVREDSFRTRIDDVQHNIGGYYLYWKNYDKLVQYGLPG